MILNNVLLNWNYDVLLATFAKNKPIACYQYPIYPYSLENEYCLMR